MLMVAEANVRVPVELPESSENKNGRDGRKRGASPRSEAGSGNECARVRFLFFLNVMVAEVHVRFREGLPVELPESSEVVTLRRRSGDHRRGVMGEE
jgi:hypothetical protein